MCWSSPDNGIALILSPDKHVLRGMILTGTHYGWMNGWMDGWWGKYMVPYHVCRGVLRGQGVQPEKSKSYAYVEEQLQ